MKGNMDVFSTVRSLCATKGIGSRTVYVSEKLKDLDIVFGKYWDERVFNQLGDFAYVDADTFQFHISKPKNIKSFVYQGRFLHRASTGSKVRVGGNFR